MSVLLNCNAMVTAISEPISQLTVSANTKNGSPLQYQDALTGDFRTYSANRTRLVTSVSEVVTISGVALEGVIDAERRLLFAWKGLPVLLRDSNGIRLWGSYLNPQVQYYTLSNPKICTVTFDFRGLTFNEQTLSQFTASH